MSGYSVDLERCVRCASCAILAPQIFEVNRRVQLLRQPETEAELRAVEAAAIVCPTQAISRVGEIPADVGRTDESVAKIGGADERIAKIGRADERAARIERNDESGAEIGRAAERAARIERNDESGAEIGRPDEAAIIEASTATATVNSATRTS